MDDMGMSGRRDQTFATCYFMPCICCFMNNDLVIHIIRNEV